MLFFALLFLCICTHLLFYFIVRFLTVFWKNFYLLHTIELSATYSFRKFVWNSKIQLIERCIKYTHTLSMSPILFFIDSCLKSVFRFVFQCLKKKTHLHFFTQHEKRSHNREYLHCVLQFNSIRWSGIIMHLHCAQIRLFCYYVSFVFHSLNELIHGESIVAIQFARSFIFLRCF